MNGHFQHVDHLSYSLIFCHIRILFYHIGSFRRICINIIQFFVGFRRITNFQSHQLPTIRCHNRLLSSKFKELIINTIMLLLSTFSRKSRQIRYTINILRNIRLHQSPIVGKIPKCRNMIGNYSLWNNSRPLNDERSTDTSFI